jgi:hypothetical protein
LRSVLIFIPIFSIFSRSQISCPENRSQAFFSKFAIFIAVMIADTLCG